MTANTDNQFVEFWKEILVPKFMRFKHILGLLINGWAISPPVLIIFCKNFVPLGPLCARASYSNALLFRRVHRLPVSDSSLTDSSVTHQALSLSVCDSVSRVSNQLVGDNRLPNRV